MSTSKPPEAGRGGHFGRHLGIESGNENDRLDIWVRKLVESFEVVLTSTDTQNCI
jgi:hypothetical protein